MLPISVCMIVKNEEKKIERCLNSVQKYGFEIIVVDTGSTDKTKDVASRFTNKIYDFMWCDDFSAARNYSLKQATHDWIFMLDSDETVESLDLEELEYFMKNMPLSVGAVTRRNQVTSEGGKIYSIDRTERLYSRKYYHYIGRIHEQLAPIEGEMSCYLLNSSIWHDGYDMTEEERIKKAERNISLLERQMKEEGANAYILYQLGKGYEIKEDYKTACEYFEKALEYDVDTELAYVQEMILSYGDDLLRIGEKEKALGLEAVYNIFSESADFLYLMGRIYQENNLFTEALVEYNKATTCDYFQQEGANSYLAYYHMAMIYKKQNRIAKALEALNKCKEYGPAATMKNLIDAEQTQKKLAVFVATHVSFQPPNNPVYIPLHVGREGKPDLGYLGDNIGENISDLNFLYGELTGLYWIWQNITDMDYVGMCHYRRYFLNSAQKEMQRNEYLNLMKEYDVIVPIHGECENNYREHYGRAHNIHDLEAVERAVKKIYPDYLESFLKAMNGTVFYSGNLCITSLRILKDYAEWLFNIFVEASEEIDVSGYDAYHRRVYGFLSEQMMYVYIMKNNLSYIEIPVGISEEKAETKELKAKLADFLSQRKIKEAKQLFDATLKERPDVLLAGSDLNQELRYMYQIIHICILEEEKYSCMTEDKKTGLLSYSVDMKELIIHYKKVLEILRREKEEKITEEDKIYLKCTGVSEIAVEEIKKNSSIFQKS